MLNNMFRKGLVLGVIVLFIGASVTPSIGGNVSKMNDIKDVETRTIKDAIQTNDGKSHTTSTTDWWSMFHHDLHHSGYSTSEAPDTNNVLWDYTTGNYVVSSPAVADGKVYIGSEDNNVYCLDADDGTKIWHYTTGDIVSSSPAVADGKVYVGSCDNKVYCLDADDGTKIWDYTTIAEDSVYSSPAVADGKVYIGSFDRRVYCLDADNGDFIWLYYTGSSVFSSPAVADGKVYIGSADGRLYCLDADDGTKIWEYNTGDIMRPSPAVADGKVYIGSFNGRLYCLDADDGTKIWDYTTGDIVLSSPAVADGKVYIGSEDNNVYCLDADDGTNIWDYTTGNIVVSSPAVADGKVYIGSCDNKLYCLDADDGTKIWHYTSGNDVYSSPAVADGKVYVGSCDNKVYCFGESEPEPFYFVHITDTHIDASDDTWGSAVRLFDTLDYIRNFNPSPAFVIISGDLAEVGNDENYERFKTRFFKNTGSHQLYIDFDRTIPIYICPGNHDHRWSGLEPYDDALDYPGENNEHCYAEYLENPPVQIVSIDSGADVIWEDEWIPPWDYLNALKMPEGTGFSPGNIEWLTNILDNNNLKIVFMHHPVINYYEVWDDGCIRWRKDAFLDLCRDNHVGLVLCGHTHDYEVYEHSQEHYQREITSQFDGDDNGHHYYLTYDSESSYTRTLNVQTPDTASYYAYRKISVDGDEIKVYAYGYAKPTGTGGITWHIGDGLRNGNESKIARLHVYDSQGNHIGENDTGGVDFEIDGGYYSPLIGVNETLYGVEASVNFGEDDYIFIIEGIENGTITFKCDYLCGETMGEISAHYSNISIMNTSVGKLYVKIDSINHTIYMDDDGDGVVDREIEPTNITTPPPYKPARPDGPTSGKPDIKYTYTTSTTDPNKDDIYYWFDWGDGTNSGWIGPYNSGDTCTTSYKWNKKGSYQIRVKAKDIYDCESVWSDPLSVRMPRDKTINNLFLNFLKNHPNLFPIIRQLLGLQ